MILQRKKDQFYFICKKSGYKNARIGIIQTPNGTIHTPYFFICATRGTVKGLQMEKMIQTNASILLCNTLHLYLRPGYLIENFGDIHSYIGWKKPIFTDSGGYQIFSMGNRIRREIKKKKISSTKKNTLIEKITSDGVHFRSYIDGRKIFLTPEKILQYQIALKSDFAVPLDQCTPYEFGYQKTKEALERTIDWANRSVQIHREYKKKYSLNQVLYGVLQGGIYRDLRQKSFESIQKEEDFFGLAIGGSLGKTKQEMYSILSFIMQKVSNQNRPIHLFGIGKIEDIFRLVPLGIDTFDCVYPTRLARHGIAIVKGAYGGSINLRKRSYEISKKNIDPSYDTIKENRAYIHHMLRNNEMVALQLLTYHNIVQMLRLMKEIRNFLIHQKQDWSQFVKTWDPSLEI